MDGFIQVTEEDAFRYAQRAAKEEGIFVGPSSGAVLAAVAQKLKEIPKGSRVLAFCYDTGERYCRSRGCLAEAANVKTTTHCNTQRRQWELSVGQFE